MAQVTQKRIPETVNDTYYSLRQRFKYPKNLTKVT